MHSMDQQPTPAAALSVIDAGLSLLGECDPAELTGAALGEQLVELHRSAARLAAQFTRAIEVFHTRGDGAADGMLSTASWLGHRLRLSRSEAHQQVAVAMALPRLPQTASALAAGSISYRHAAVISRGAERVGVEVVAEAEPVIIEAALRLDPPRLSHVLTQLRHLVDPDGADADAAADHDRRGLWASTTLDSMVAVNGLLDPDTGAALLEALNSGAPPEQGDQRTPAQRRADRLGEVLRGYLDSGAAPASGGQRPHVTVTMDLATLRGAVGAPAAHLQWIGPLDSATARLIACDCQVTAVVTDEHGLPLNVGWRYRTATAAQRTALAVRDGHCQAPGCDRPPIWCDAHHVLPWHYGGRTDLSNLILLCRRHHRAVHQGIWRIESHGNGRFTFHHHTRDPERRRLSPPDRCGGRAATPATSSQRASPRRGRSGARCR